MGIATPVQLSLYDCFGKCIFLCPKLCDEWVEDEIIGVLDSMRFPCGGWSFFNPQCNVLSVR